MKPRQCSDGSAQKQHTVKERRGVAERERGCGREEQRRAAEGSHAARWRPSHCFFDACAKDDLGGGQRFYPCPTEIRRPTDEKRTVNPLDAANSWH